MNQGDCVYYINKDGEKVKAVIVKIHFDDIEPYYTIRLKGDDTERQTISSRLKPRKPKNWKLFLIGILEILKLEWAVNIVMNV